MKYLAALILLVGMVVIVTRSGPTETPVSKYTGTPCAEHGITDGLCTRCHPELAARFKKNGDWCAEHRMPESQDDLCHPELAKKSAASPELAGPEKLESDAEVALDWCAEHRVPESRCTKCNPELVARFKADGDWCKSHGVPESHCYRCNPELKFPQEAEYLKLKSKDKEESGLPREGHPETALYRTNAPACATDGAVIQLTSVESARRAGLSIEEVQAVSLPEILEAPAEVEFDATSSYAVTSLVSGTLVKWLVQPGEHVRQGQILAYLQSIEGASLKAECSHAQAVLNLAKNAFDRAKTLGEGGMMSQRELQEAEADYLRAQADNRKAAGALRALGMPPEEIDKLGDDEGANTTLAVHAGQSGVLVEQRVDLGAVLAPGESIGLISETEKLWIEAQVRERDISRVKVGQVTVVSVDGQGVSRCQGTVSWIAAEVDPLTRMGRVRVEVRPNGSNLRAHQFVRVKISATVPDETVSVPAEAVQWEGCCNVVFVAETCDRFRPRKVTVEFANGQDYAVSGLNPGEKIVGHGSYLLKTELMKGSIGAGCCGTGA
jgi:cobalt-zinc-cadmium efflux system membrane fusion protein